MSVNYMFQSGKVRPPDIEGDIEIMC